MSQPSITAEDAVQVAQRALQTVNELQSDIEDLRQENQELRQRVTELEAAQPDASDYESLDRDDKVGLVRQHLLRKARDNNGRAQITYNGVRWEVFDGEPSPAHCYTLLEQAANEPGFTFGTDADDNKALKVDTAETTLEKDATGLLHANKENTE